MSESITVNAEQIAVLDRFCKLLGDDGAVSVVQVPDNATIVVKLPEGALVGNDAFVRIKAAVTDVFGTNRVLIIPNDLTIEIGKPQEDG